MTPDLESITGELFVTQLPSEHGHSTALAVPHRVQALLRAAGCGPGSRPVITESVWGVLGTGNSHVFMLYTFFPTAP